MQCGELTAEETGWKGVWLDVFPYEFSGEGRKSKCETYLYYL